MELSFSEKHELFRREVRDWIASSLPPKLAAKAAIDAPFTVPESTEWHKILYQKGWIAPNWPKEYGGCGFDATERFIFTEELELQGTPELSPFGLSMVGPLIVQFGSPEQKKRYLPKILSGEEVWCQGYSEPNAGSDLASLTCSAIDDGNGNFIVNGQKTWTTYAQYADWIFCLVRSDNSGKKQEGISFLLIDMKTPGIEARPMMTIGGTPAFCDTFFDNVLVPKENLVGPLHGGWTLAKALLGHERTLIAAVGRSRRVIKRIKTIASSTMVGGKSLFDQGEYRNRIAKLEIRHKALQMANYRALAGAQLGRAPGPESSILKIVGTEILQECYELAMDLMGHNSINWFNENEIVPPYEQFIPSMFNYSRAATIYGGSNEIQKNVIAKYILQLPR